MPLSLTDLRLFVAVAELGNLTRAVRGDAAALRQQELASALLRLASPI